MQLGQVLITVDTVIGTDGLRRKELFGRNILDPASVPLQLADVVSHRPVFLHQQFVGERRRSVAAVEFDRISSVLGQVSIGVVSQARPPSVWRTWQL